MTLLHHYDGTLLTNRVQLVEEKGFSARAVLGEADTIHVIVDDPNSALMFLGRKVWKMVEDACPAGNQVVWRGVTGTKRISRGSGAVTFPLGRRWTVELIEDNVRLGRRAITVTTAARPAETVSARLTWLLTTPGYSGVVFDRGLVESCTVILDANDYTNRTGLDVLRDCAMAAGYNFFVRYREATDDLELAFRDDDVSQLDTSVVRITNAGDADLVTIWPGSYDAELEQSPERMADEIVLPYRGGTVVRTSATPPADIVSLVAPTAAVKTAATATTLADRLLAQHDEEDERIPSIVIQVPAANLNDVKAGHLINVKQTHLPGFATYRPCRVLSKAFSRPPNLTQAVYDVDLALSPAITPTATHARLMRPNDDEDLIFSPPGPGTLYPIHWSFDGDNPKGGDAGDVKSGPVNYYPVGAKPANGWTGLIVLGDGYLDVEGRWDCEAVTSGTVSFTGEIRRNGVVVATHTVSRTSGLSAWNPSVSPSATAVLVHAGDIITGRSFISDAAQLALPAGTGNSSDRLMVTGQLAAHP